MVESSQQEPRPMPPGPVTQIAVITIAQSDYGNEVRNLPTAEQDAQTMHDCFRKMGVPEDRIFHLVNPNKAKFFAAIQNVVQLAKNGARTQLFLHYAGHGMANGGYIALFGPHNTVNLSFESSELSRECDNVWVLMVFDACAEAQKLEARGDFDFTAAAPVGAYKTFTIAASRQGKQAFGSWKFTKSFADFMAKTVTANKGLFKIPEDVFDFEGPNGEHEKITSLTKKNYIALQFPIANLLSKPQSVIQTTASTIPKLQPAQKLVSKKYSLTYTVDVAKNPKRQDQSHPVKEKLNWFNPLVGVSEHPYQDAYQFISFDGARSAFLESDLRKNESWIYYILPRSFKWVDYIIPQGKQIRTVETLLSKGLGFLCGFKWIGDDGAVLLAFGYINWPSERNASDYVVTTLTLNHNQRLVGVRSGSGGDKYAYHYSFQWVICTEE